MSPATQRIISSADTTHELVHICGFPSSGTDLLSNFMSAHPDIEVRGEFPLLMKSARKFGAEVPIGRVDEVVKALRDSDVYGNFANPRPDLAPVVDGRESVPLAAIYIAMLSERNVRWCGNKTPQNTENIDKLLDLFPQSRIVFIVRDIRDVCVSWRRKWGKNMYLCAAKWNARMAAGLRMMESLPDDRVLHLQYEQFIADPIGVGHAISDFLDVPYHENFENYHQFVRSNPDGKKNYGKPIQPSNRGNWRWALDREEAQRIEEIAFPMMQRFGYTPQFAERHRRITPAEIATGLADDVGAAFFFGNQFRAQNRLRDRLRKVSISIRYRMPHT